MQEASRIFYSKSTLAPSFPVWTGKWGAWASTYTKYPREVLMCVHAGGDVIIFGTEMLNKWWSIPVLPSFPEFTSPPASKRHAKGSRWTSYASHSLSQVFSYRTFYFLIETTALCSTEEYLSIRTKGGVRFFELLLRLLNVLFNLVPLSGQTVGESCFTKVITTKQFRLWVKSYFACNGIFLVVPDNDCNPVGQSLASKQHGD